MINTYRKPANLFIANSDEEIFSEEGTTQGDTGAMGMYACSLIPLVEHMKHRRVTIPQIKLITNHLITSHLM